jgi:7-cyano-7-deazaguanine synthase
VEWSKTRIVREALRLGVPIATTWSCYGGGSLPCGLCDSCRIRDAALLEAGRADLTSAALGNGSSADPEAVDLKAVATQRAAEP